jgi:hypothetical protein
LYFRGLKPPIEMNLKSKKRPHSDSSGGLEFVDEDDHAMNLDELSHRSDEFMSDD